MDIHIENQWMLILLIAENIQGIQMSELLFITSTKEVMCSPLFVCRSVCLLVSRIIKLLNRFPPKLVWRDTSLIGQEGTHSYICTNFTGNNVWFLVKKMFSIFRGLVSMSCAMWCGLIELNSPVGPWLWCDCHSSVNYFQKKCCNAPMKPEICW